MCKLHLSEPLFNMPCAKCNAMCKLHLRNTGSPFAMCNVLYRLMCNVHLLSGQSAVSSMSTWLREFESCNAMLNVPSQISRHICCRLETFNHLLCIAQCARLFAVVLVCISCLSRLLAFLCLPFAQAQSLGVFSCDSKAYLRVFSSDLNTHLTASYPAYSNISPHSFAEF